jgi:TldD protein
MRADGWARLPLIRMTNVAFSRASRRWKKSSTWTTDLHGDESQWSIDDKRYNFQFGCEIGWEIRTATRRMLKNPSYRAFPPVLEPAAIAGSTAWGCAGVSRSR